MYLTIDGDRRSWMRTGNTIWQAFCQGVEGSESRDMYHNCKGLPKALKCQKHGENKKAKALWSGIDFCDLGRLQKMQNSILSKVGLLGNPPELPNGCLGRRGRRTAGRARSSAVGGGET